MCGAIGRRVAVHARLQAAVDAPEACARALQDAYNAQAARMVTADDEEDDTCHAAPFRVQ